MVSFLTITLKNDFLRYYDSGKTFFCLFKSHENGPKMGPKCKKMEKTGLNFEPRAQPKSKKW